MAVASGTRMAARRGARTLPAFLIVDQVAPLFKAGALLDDHSGFGVEWLRQIIHELP